MAEDKRAARSTYLGQFEEETANAIAEVLEGAEIAWAFKSSGRFTRFFFISEWGVRLFVDAERLEEAKRLAAEVIQRRQAATGE